MTTCSCCKTDVATFDTYFSASGEVCAACHTHEAAHDSARMAEGAEDAGDVLFEDSGSFSLYLGPVNIVPILSWLVRFVREAFARLKPAS